MSGRAGALVVCALSFAAVCAAYVWPRWPGFHTWEYASVLFIGVLLVGSSAWSVLRAPGERKTVGLGLACLGTLVALVAGLASGLLGPDTQAYARGPGTVLPLPDVGIAAAFPIADAAAIGRGDSTLELRRRDHTVEPLATGSRRIDGAFALEAESRPAAFVRAADPAGRHMTITQPTGTAFLSPVLLFPNTVHIGQNDVASDSFSVPALERTIKAVYFPAKILAQTSGHGELRGKDAVLFVVDDPNGKLAGGGIGMATGGGSVKLGGVTIWPTLGAYPQLVVSSVPPPLGVGLGFVLFVIGTALIALPLEDPKGEKMMGENLLNPG